jgi:hypothetical protein
VALFVFVTKITHDRLCLHFWWNLIAKIPYLFCLLFSAVQFSRFIFNIFFVKTLKVRFFEALISYHVSF